MDTEPDADAFVLNTLIGGGDDEFMKQLKGSGAANALTIGLMFLFWVLRNKCKHFRCTGHSICCTVEVNDDDSKEEIDLERGEGGGQFSPKTQEKMFELFKSKYPGVFSKRPQVASTD